MQFSYMKYNRNRVQNMLASERQIIISVSYTHLCNFIRFSNVALVPLKRSTFVNKNRKSSRAFTVLPDRLSVGSDRKNKLQNVIVIY